MTAPEIHVERTGDPTVMRWVCHRVDLGSPGIRCPSNTDESALAGLHHRNEIVGIRTIDGDLLVSAPDTSSWSSLAARVHDAIVAELTRPTGPANLAPWLTAAPTTLSHAMSDAMATPTIAEVQAVVDQAAGAVAASHGGRIEVVAVNDTSVHVIMHGACHGCSGANTTLNELVRRAVTGRWPHLTAMADEPPARPTLVPVRFARRGATSPS